MTMTSNRVLTILIVIVLCGTWSTFAVGEARTINPNTTQPFMYAVNDETAWIISNDVIASYHLDNLTTPVSTISVAGVEHVYADKNGLYISRQGEGQQEIVLLDQSGKALQSWKMTEGLSIAQFIVTDGEIIAAVTSRQGAVEAVDEHILYSLYRIDMKTGEQRKSNNLSTIHAIAAGSAKDTVLLLYVDATDSLSVGILSLSDDEIDNTFTLPGMEFSAVCPGENGCYLLSELGIHFLDFLAGSTSLVYDLDELHTNLRGLQRAGGYLATEDFGSLALLLFPMQTDQNHDQLTLVNLTKFHDARIDKAISLFAAKYPNVEVKFRDVNDDVLITSLMANEPDNDIILITGYDLPTYRNSGILTNLADHPEIVANMKNWIEMPNLYQAGIYSVPLYVMPIVFHVNDDLSSTVEGILPEYPYTWGDLYAAADKLKTQKGIKLLTDSKRFPTVLYQYLALCEKRGNVDFDTDVFKEVMSKYKDAFDGGIIADEEVEKGALEKGVVAFYPAGVKILQLPTLDGQDVVPVQIYSLGMNKASDKVDWAAAFLECYTSSDAQAAVKINMMGSGLLKDESLYSSASNDDPRPDEVTVDIWTTLLKNGVITSFNTDFYIYMGDQVERYIGGELSLEDLIRNLNNKYAMTQQG